MKRILLGLGGTPHGKVAVQRAVELAKRHGAELTAITIVDGAMLKTLGHMADWALNDSWQKAEFRIPKLSQTIDELFGHAETQAREASIPFRAVRASGNPFETLIKQWRYHDLTLLGLRGLFDYGVLPEPSNAIIRLIQSGIRPILATAPEYRPVQRALVCYSGSADSAKTMKQFMQLGLWPGAKIRIVCFEKESAEASDLLNCAAEYVRLYGYEAETLAIGIPARTGILPAASSWNADVIVMGNSARTMLARHVFGDTAKQVVRVSDCAVFLSH